MAFSNTGAYREPRQMYGVPGIIYILENSGLRPGFYKIGFTRRSGWAKAVELNRDLQNSIPGSFECVFEHRAKNCGAALDDILKEIHFCRRGKRDQNFFEIDCNRLQEIIMCSIAHTDQQSKIREYQERVLRQYLDEEKLQNPPQAKNEQVSVSIFRKAYLWMSAVAH
jgi:hypothetical protein